MMSRNFLRFFCTPLKQAVEITAYSVGAAGVGTIVYQAGNYVNEKTQEQRDHFRNQETNNTHTEEPTQHIQSGMKL